MSLEDVLLEVPQIDGVTLFVRTTGVTCVLALKGSWNCYRLGFFLGVGVADYPRVEPFSVCDGQVSSPHAT